MFSGPPNLVQALPVLSGDLAWARKSSRAKLSNDNRSKPSLSNAKAHCDLHHTCRFSQGNCVPQSCPNAQIYRKQASLGA